MDCEAKERQRRCKNTETRCVIKWKDRGEAVCADDKSTENQKKKKLVQSWRSSGKSYDLAVDHFFTIKDKNVTSDGSK